MARAKLKTTRWDPAESLADARSRAAYLEAALEDGDAAVVAAALGDIARAEGMSAVARKSGLGRESLYKALAPGANPRFDTVMRVTKALGLQYYAASTRKEAVKAAIDQAPPATPAKMPRAKAARRAPVRSSRPRKRVAA